MFFRKRTLSWLSKVILAAALLLGILLISACGEQADEPGATKAPAQPKNTPVPAQTAVPTITPTPTPTRTPTPTPTPTPDPSFPMGTTHYSFGVNAHLYYPEVCHPHPDIPNLTQDDIMGYVDELGVEWVRQQVSWGAIEGEKGVYDWTELDKVIAAVGRHNRKLLVDVVRSPAWATETGGHGMPADPNDLGDFLFVLASRYQGQIQAYEVWNEQNYAIENDGYVQGAGRYVELLKVAFTRIKEADPHAIVLFGPLTPTGVNDPEVAIDDLNYLRQIYEYQGGVVRDYFDVLGAHAAGSNNPPDTLWPDNPGPGEWTTHSSHYFRQVENLHTIMEAYGDGHKQIWLTEFGWASLDGITDTPSPGYGYASDNSAVVQADYLVWALSMGKNRMQPWMGNMFVWNLNFAACNAPTDEKSAFSMLRPDWGTQPAYRAVMDHVVHNSEWP